MATTATPPFPPPVTTTPTAPPRRTLTHLTAGLFSGISSAVVLQPADLLKTRIQQSPPHTTLLHLIRTLPLPELWRGTVPSALRTGVGSALYFTTLNHLREAVSKWNYIRPRIAGRSGGVRDSSTLVKLSPTGNLLTGALARASVGYVMMPITIIKVRFESDVFQYKSIGGAARDIFKTLGIKGFFAGYGATAVRDAPYAGLYVLFYEHSKKQLGHLFPGPKGESEMSQTRAWTINTASAMMSGAAATTLTNPFDTIKTRIQVFPDRYRNTWRAAVMIIRDEGVRRLFDGLGLRIARKAVSSGVVWGAYEWAVRRSWKKEQ